jgi:putative ATP-dependent endonuclease of OLD family
MRIERVAVKNFRSIKDEIVFDVPTNLCVLVGQNNVGKSNILKLLDLFFNGTIEGQQYVRERDLPERVRETARTARTKVRVRFQIDTRKKAERSIWEEWSEELGVTGEDHTLTIQREWLSDKSVDRIITGKTPTAGERATELYNDLTRQIFFVYLPSRRDFADFARSWLDLLAKTLAIGWGKGPKLGRAVPQLRNSLDEFCKKTDDYLKLVGSEISESLRKTYERIVSFDLDLQTRELRQILASVLISANDGAKTEMDAKGAGFQSIAVIHALEFLGSGQVGKHVVLALEEPEAFLHPGAQKDIISTLHHFAKQTQIMITTHSPLMLNRESSYSNILVDVREENGNPQTVIRSRLKSRELWSPFREALGCALEDYLPFGQVNLFVEGESDSILLKGIIERLDEFDRGDLKKRCSNLRFVIMAGANNALSFYGLYRAFLVHQRAVILLDGDGPGRQAADQLKRRFSLRDNVDYIVLEKERELEHLCAKEHFDACLTKLEAAIGGNPVRRTDYVGSQGSIEIKRVHRELKADLVVEIVKGKADHLQTYVDLLTLITTCLHNDVDPQLDLM